jgi:CP family cyanate transporter-like MFS transporter
MSRIFPLSRLYRSSAYTLVGVMLIAASLRAPITGIAPLTEMISGQLSLSGAAAGMLMTLPLLAFALVSLATPALARRYGLERSLFAAMALMVVGVLLRSAGSACALFGGTAIASTGIAIGNVLLPSLLKRDCPRQAAALTAVYVLVLSIAAGVASAVAVPLAGLSAATWRFSAAALLVLPLLAALVWAPQLGRRRRMAAGRAQLPTASVWRSALAWQVTFYLGINSFVFYVCIGWLPAILRDAGHSAAQAGALHGLLQMMSAVPALIIGPLLRRLPDQRALGASAALLSLLGLSGLLVLPGWSEAWVVLLGLGTGAGVILGLAFVTLRTDSPQLAAALSSMAQCVGYLLASAGPVLVGAIHGATGNWRAPLVLCAAMCGLMALAALGAGRNVQLERPGPARPRDATVIAGTAQ